MEAHVLRSLTVDNPWLKGEDLGPWLARQLPDP